MGLFNFLKKIELLLQEQTNKEMDIYSHTFEFQYNFSKNTLEQTM